MNWQETLAFLTPCFPEEAAEALHTLHPGELREIRVRADRNAQLCTADRVVVLPWRPCQQQVETLAEALSGHSLYARAEETGRGFATLAGGHRMGLCGSVRLQDGRLQLSEINSLCIRIAAQWLGSADALLPLCRQGAALRSLLIIGPPGSGKTTLLRDLARQLASGERAAQTAVIDERGELAACANGTPQLDVGEAADVLTGCSKPEAVGWLMRAMSPQLIVTDELADAADVAALLDAMSCGAAVVASAHGMGLNDLASRPAMAAMLAQRRFSAYAVLSAQGCGRIAALYDRTGSPLKAR